MGGGMMGGLAGGLGGIAGSLFDFGLGEASAKMAYNRARKMAKKRIPWMVQGLRAAGLNPILAAQGGFSAGTAGAQPAAYRGGTDLFGPAETMAATAVKREEEELRRQQAEAAQAAAGASKSQDALNRAHAEVVTFNARSAAAAAELAEQDMEFWRSPEGQALRRVKHKQESMKVPLGGLGALVSEIPNWFGSEQEFEALRTIVPPWNKPPAKKKKSTRSKGGK